MGHRSALLLPLSLACACVAPPATPPAAPPDASVIAPAPRKITGKPVALLARQPLAVPGAERAWMMPDANLVSLTPPDEEGRRSVLGPAFWGGPGGAMLGVELSGELQLTVDGAIHRLGRYNSAAFEAAGRSVLVWDHDDWALYSRAGTRLRAEKTSASEPLLLPSGTLVEHLLPSGTRVSDAAGKEMYITESHCGVVHGHAQRLLCVDDSRASSYQVRALDTGSKLAEIDPQVVGAGRNVAFAFRADGGALAMMAEKLVVVDIAPGRASGAPRVIHRRTPDTTGKGRLAFTLDGEHVCVEDADGTRILDSTAAAPKSTVPSRPRAPAAKRATCLFAQRGEPAEGPGADRFPGEWDAILLELPARPGFEPVRRKLLSQMRYDPQTRVFMSPAYGEMRLEGEGVSLDRRTAVITEMRTFEEKGERKGAVELVVVDVATASVKREIPLGTVGAPSSFVAPFLRMSGDGTAVEVCSFAVFGDGCRTFDTGTGELRAPGIPAKLGSAQLHVSTTGWIEVQMAPTLEAARVPLDPKVKVTWRDEGHYLSTQIERAGGDVLRVNVPDGNNRGVLEIGAIAGGELLAVASLRSVELWSVEPLALRALLVPEGKGAVAFLADGTVEAIGDGAEGALACQQEPEIVLPIERCGDVRAPSGTLAALVRGAGR